MATWTDKDLLALDAKYALTGVKPHQRPFRAAMDILGSAFSIGVGGNTDVDRITADYRRLFPDLDASWPGMGFGIAASVDQVRRVTLPVVYGTVSIQPWEPLGFKSKEEWWAWCRQDNDIAAESAFSFADLSDFAYGLNEVERTNAEATGLWRMARSNLEDVGNALPTTFSVDSIIQPICMVVELSLKALLVWGGADPNSFKGPGGHNLTKLAERVATEKPHRDDAAVADVIAKLPPYVASRYRAAGLTRLQVVRLALGVQFISASTLRRVSSRDLALVMENGSWPGPRRPFCPSPIF